MKLLKNGKGILVSVENITPFGIWLYIKGKEYFLNYKDYPYFKNQTINDIQNVIGTYGKAEYGRSLFNPLADGSCKMEGCPTVEEYTKPVP